MIICQRNYKMQLSKSSLWLKNGMNAVLRHILTVCISHCVHYYSECNSNRDSVLSYTSVRSNSSYLGSDEMGSGKRMVVHNKHTETV